MVCRLASHRLTLVKALIYHSRGRQKAKEGRRWCWCSSYEILGVAKTMCMYLPHALSWSLCALCSPWFWKYSGGDLQAFMSYQYSMSTLLCLRFSAWGRRTVSFWGIYLDELCAAGPNLDVVELHLHRIWWPRNCALQLFRLVMKASSRNFENSVQIAVGFFNFA